MAEIRNISEFKSGTFQSQNHYKTFSPHNIHYDWMVDVPELAALVSKADRLLGALNAYSELVPNVDFFIRMHINKEATKSSRIEGTKTNMEEVLLKAEDVTPEKKDDWTEVHNYINAINHSIDKLKNLPIRTELIKDAHQVLMQGARGATKNPGEYRQCENYIGATLYDATYVPPHHDLVDDLMRDFEHFLNDEKIHTPHLIRIGMLHYQFETIHPFLDGNGRMGRLLITLYLVSKKLMPKPALYLSDFFEHFRSYYYDNLQRVRTHNDMTQWLKFFLVGVIETTNSSILTFKEILKLKEKIEQRVLPKFSSRQKKATEILDILYNHPLIGIKDLMLITDINYASANRIINELIDLQVLKEFDLKVGRSKFYVFEEYLNIFSGEPDYKRQEIFFDEKIITQ